MSPEPSARDSRPKVLMLATRVPAEPGDGTPSFVIDGAMALADRFDTTVLAPRMRTADGSSLHSGVRVERYAYLPRRWERIADTAIMPQLSRRPSLWLQAAALTAMMLIHALRLHRRISPSLVHAHWILPSGLVALILRMLTGAPYVVTSHGADAFRLETGPSRLLKRAVLRRASAVIAVSGEIAEKLSDLRSDVHVQPVGVDFAAWSPVAQERAPEQGRVLFVGRLSEKKGVESLIRGIEGVAGASLRIAGEGEQEAELRRLVADEGLSARVEFLGRLSRTALAEELRVAMCVAIPSVTAADGDRDGTPTVLGEAAAAGVPVIASRLGGLQEGIVEGSTGLLHVPGDVDGLRACIERMMTDEHLGRVLAQNAHEHLRGLLDAPVVADRHADWYRSAIASRAAGR